MASTYIVMFRGHFGAHMERNSYSVDTLAGGGQVVDTRERVLNREASTGSKNRLLSLVDGELDLSPSERGREAGRLRLQLEGVGLELVQDRLRRLEEL